MEPDEDRNRIEERLMEADRLSSLPALVVGVVHDINNPLTAVMFNVNDVAGELSAVAADLRDLRDPTTGGLAGEDLARLLGELTDMVGQLREAGEGLARVRDSVRDLRVFATGAPHHSNQVCLPALARKVLSYCRGEFKTRATVSEDLGDVPDVPGSEGRLAQAIVNLLRFVARGLPEGDAAAHTLVLSATTDERAQRVVITLSHNGPAMDPAALDRAMTAAGALDPGGPARPPADVGLASVRAILAEHGGELRVHGGASGEQRFELVLPVSAAARAAPGQGKPHRRPADGRPVVLIIDDEAMIRRVLQRLLRSRYNVELAESGCEGRAVLEAGLDPDVVLCDLNLRDMLGTELHGWICDERPALGDRFVMMTGGMISPRCDAYLKEHGLRRLDKPFETEDCLNLVAELVGGGVSSG